MEPGCRTRFCSNDTVGVLLTNTTRRGGWAAKSPQAALKARTTGGPLVGRSTMHRRYRAALIGGVLAGLIALGSQASAQSVPMPVPAPHSRLRAGPPPSAKALAAAPKHVAQVSTANAAQVPPGAIAAKPAIARMAAGGALDGSQK